MTNFIPIFPLQLVVFPGEHLNLHIFEPQYKQLIQECFEQKKPFGIPSVLNGTLRDYGSLIHIREVTRTYANGELDIKTRAGKVFRVLEIIREVPDRLYSGAIVNYPPDQANGDPDLMRRLIGKMKDLHASLQVKKEFVKSEAQLNAFDIAHHCGLDLEQEFELLQLAQERQRQEYLKRHFEAALPAFEAMRELREKIQMNGHFKNLGGFSIK